MGGRRNSFDGLSTILDHPYVTPEPNSGCWLWFGNTTGKGYGLVRFQKQFMVAHRVALIIAGRPRPEGMFALHKCNNRACVNPDHLYWGTAQQNMQDAVRAGTLQARFKGEKHPAARLTEKNVIEIRRLGKAANKTELASRYGVTVACIKDVLNNRSWAHVAL